MRRLVAFASEEWRAARLFQRILKYLKMISALPHNFNFLLHFNRHHHHWLLVKNCFHLAGSFCILVFVTSQCEGLGYARPPSSASFSLKIVAIWWTLKECTVGNFNNPSRHSRPLFSFKIAGIRFLYFQIVQYKWSHLFFLCRVELLRGQLLSPRLVRDDAFLNLFCRASKPGQKRIWKERENRNKLSRFEPDWRTFYLWHWPSFRCIWRPMYNSHLASVANLTKNLRS